MIRSTHGCMSVALVYMSTAAHRNWKHRATCGMLGCRLTHADACARGAPVGATARVPWLFTHPFQSVRASATFSTSIRTSIGSGAAAAVRPWRDSVPSREGTPVGSGGAVRSVRQRPRLRFGRSVQYQSKIVIKIAVERARDHTQHDRSAPVRVTQGPVTQPSARSAPIAARLASAHPPVHSTMSLPQRQRPSEIVFSAAATGRRSPPRSRRGWPQRDYW